jgi:hypothetical protein
MHQYLENILIAWLRAQPNFTTRSRFDLELLVADLVRDIEDEVDRYVEKRLAEIEDERERDDERVLEILREEAAAERRKAKRAKRKTGARQAMVMSATD